MVKWQTSKSTFQDKSGRETYIDGISETSIPSAMDQPKKCADIPGRKVKITGPIFCAKMASC